MKWDPFHFGVTVDLAQGKIVCPKQLFDALDQRYHVLTDGASEQIDSAIIVLGPGMQTCMRLCEKQKTGKTMGAELVKASSTTVKPLSRTACANSEYARS